MALCKEGFVQLLPRHGVFALGARRMSSLPVPAFLTTVMPSFCGESGPRFLHAFSSDSRTYSSCSLVVLESQARCGAQAMQTDICRRQARVDLRLRYQASRQGRSPLSHRQGRPDELPASTTKGMASTMPFAEANLALRVLDALESQARWAISAASCFRFAHAFVERLVHLHLADNCVHRPKKKCIDCECSVLRCLRPYADFHRWCLPPRDV